MAAAVSVEETASGAAEGQDGQQESAGSPIKAEETVDTGSQHVLKVCAAHLHEDRTVNIRTYMRSSCTYKVQEDTRHYSPD